MLFTVVTIAMLTGCGGGSSATPVIPLSSNAAVATAPTVVASQAARPLGEVQFVQNAGLRANLLRDTIVYRLEPSSSPASSKDTGSPGLDIVPIRLSVGATLTVSIDSDTVDHAVIRDARGSEVFRISPGAPRTVTLDTGDHTLEFTSAVGYEAPVFIRPLTSSALPGITLSDFPPATVGVPTGVPAFVGDLASGPLNEPVEVTSWSDFSTRFGGLDPARPTTAQVYQFFNLGGQRAYVVRATPGPGGGVPPLSNFDQALATLSNLPLFDLLLVPDAARANDPPDAQLAAHAVSRAQACRALAILEVPISINTPAGAVTWLAAQPQLQSTWAAVYYGLLTARVDATTVTIGPCGTIAGFCAYTDQNIGVWSAPANVLPPCNIVDAPRLTDAEMAPLNEANISPVIMIQQATAVWGARTSAGTTSLDFRYVQQRRLYIYITKSIEQSLQWTVFAPSNAQTWYAVVNSTSSFLTNLWTQGGLSGNAASQAFAVSCGLGTTMTEEDIMNSLLRVQVDYNDPNQRLVQFSLTEIVDTP